MAKPDGRLERGQSIKKAFSANKWNDLCDAADIVHGRRGGMTAGDGRPPALRQVVTCIKGNPNELMFPGHAVQAAIGYRNPDIPVFAWNALPETADDLRTQIESSPALKTHIAQAASKRNNPNPFPVILYKSGRTTVPDISPPLGFVTELSKSGDATVRVCISGTALALVRIFETQTDDLGSGSNDKKVLFTSLVRSRRVYVDSSGSQTYVDAPNGVMDIGPGGSVLMVSNELREPPSFPCYTWVWVIL